MLLAWVRSNQYLDVRAWLRATTRYDATPFFDIAALVKLEATSVPQPLGRIARHGLEPHAPPWHPKRDLR